MTGLLTPQQRTERLLQLIGLATSVRGVVLSNTVELEPKIGELLALAFCPEPEPRRLLHTLMLGSWLGFERKVELLGALLDVEYPGVVSPDFKARLKSINRLRNAAAHYEVDASDDALEHHNPLRI